MSDSGQDQVAPKDTKSTAGDKKMQAIRGKVQNLFDLWSDEAGETKYKVIKDLEIKDPILQPLQPSFLRGQTCSSLPASKARPIRPLSI